MPDTTDDPTDPDRRRQEIADKYRFDACCTEAFDVVLAAWGRHTGDLPIGADDVTLADVDTALDHGPIGPALLDWVLGEADDGSAALDTFTTALVDSSEGPHAAARFVRAVNAETSGRVLDAEADLIAAVAEDPTHAPSTYELARFASDRGDIERAVALYRRCGPGAQPEIDFLGGLVPDHGKVGRNDPCPCGSGRKFKQCHLDRPEVPADRAVLWLFQKVLGYAYRAQFEPARQSLARAAADGALDPAAEPSPEQLEGLANDPFLLDLTVFDTGIIGRFAAERSVLLPTAEAEMLQEWMTTDRRLWEVTEVEVAVRIVLRDVLTDETVEVPERVASTSLAVGDLLLTRVVPVRGSVQLIGQPMPIGADQRQAVTALVERQAGADDWARWFGTLLAPRS